MGLPMLGPDLRKLTDHSEKSLDVFLLTCSSGANPRNLYRCVHCALQRKNDGAVYVRGGSGRGLGWRGVPVTHVPALLRAEGQALLWPCLVCAGEREPGRTVAA